MDMQQVVQSISMGSRVAEDEREALASYFVETENWRKAYEGEADLIFAPKGGGKSAIYSMLMARESEFFDRGILLTTAENPSGATAFEEVQTSSATSEGEFIGLWKIYFLSLIAQTLAEYGIKNRQSKLLLEKLNEAHLLPQSAAPRRQLVRAALDYVRAFFQRAAAVEAAVSIDPTTGAAIISPKITFSEPSPAERKSGFLFVDELFDLAQESLAEANVSIWILLDRLDVAFTESPDLEKNALRALFRVYRDLEPRNMIHLKIFLRSDIWETITKGGFREASHLTRDLRIAWSSNTLLRLAVQRLLRSRELREHYGVENDTILSNIDRQREFFYRVFPPQIDQGSKKPATFDWCLTRTRDGTGKNAPRELIHLLSETRNSQLGRFETGQAEPEGGAAFDRQAFKEALPSVSRVRLTQTLYAEHSNLRNFMAAMEGQKTLQNANSLATVWGMSAAGAAKTAEDLVAIGFFEPRGNDFWVPFMYRPALEMVQGAAEGVSASDED